MTSAVEGPPFAFSEMRPDTSKCSRGNKLNKTLTGFYPSTDSTATTDKQTTNQTAIMNGTGFNFRSNAHRQPTSGEAASNISSMKPVPPPPNSSMNVFSSTSQGFYESQAKQQQQQSSFTKGLTLDQYFNFQRDSVPQNLLEDVPQQQSQAQASIAAQVIRSDDIPRTQIRNSSRGSQSRVIPKAEHQTNNNNNSNNSVAFEKEDECYFQEDFEIHEETEEEDEDDDDKHKYQSSRAHVRKTSQINASRSSRRTTNNNRTSGYFQSNGSMNSEDIETEHPSGRAVSSRRQTKRTSSRDYMNNYQEANGEHRTAIIEEMQGQEENYISNKIRDKYFKKTMHNRPFMNNQAYPAGKMGSQQRISNSPPISPLKQQNKSNNKQLNDNNGVDAAAAAAAAAAYKTSQNFNYIPKPNGAPYQRQAGTLSTQQKLSQTGNNFYAQQQLPEQQSQKWTKESTSKSPTPFSHHNNTNNLANRHVDRSQSPHQSFKRASNVTGHPHQRQQSKEMANMMSSAIEIDEDSYMNSRMRSTFMNTNGKTSSNSNNHNNNSFIAQGKVKSSQQQMGMSSVASTYSQIHPNSINHNNYNNSGDFDNHIAFRASFYSKAGGGGGGAMVNQQHSNAANNNNNQNSKLRLTVNEFYKNQTKYPQQESYESTQMFRGQQDQLSQDAMAMMMRRTAKENKFLNQKDKIQELAFQDARYITKHAARFNINPNELSIKSKI